MIFIEQKERQLQRMRGGRPFGQTVNSRRTVARLFYNTGSLTIFSPDSKADGMVQMVVFKKFLQGANCDGVQKYKQCYRRRELLCVKKHPVREATQRARRGSERMSSRVFNLRRSYLRRRWPCLKQFFPNS